MKGRPVISSPIATLVTEGVETTPTSLLLPPLEFLLSDPDRVSQLDGNPTLHCPLSQCQPCMGAISGGGGGKFDNFLDNMLWVRIVKHIKLSKLPPLLEIAPNVHAFVNKCSQSVNSFPPFVTTFEFMVPTGKYVYTEAREAGQILQMFSRSFRGRTRTSHMSVVCTVCSLQW